jgi:hypothetical protein
VVRRTRQAHHRAWAERCCLASSLVMEVFCGRPAKKDHQPFIIPPPQPTAPPPADVLHRQEPRPPSVIPHQEVPSPGSIHNTATSSTAPPRGTHPSRFTSPLDHATAWDSQRTASSPPLGYQATKMTGTPPGHRYSTRPPPRRRQWLTSLKM